MRFTINKETFYFYSAFFLLALGAYFVVSTGSQSALSAVGSSKSEQRVIRCQLPLPNGMTQNLYYVAESLQLAKKTLFNNKNGLYFDNALYIKTKDFEGKEYVVPFDRVACDAVGTQVTSL